MNGPPEDPRVTAGRAVVVKVLGEELGTLAAELRSGLERLLLPNEKVTAVSYTHLTLPTNSRV